jgi:histidinol-phosphate aminotransferase
MPLRPLTPDYIQGISPYVPGKPVREVEREYGVPDALKLASNENGLGASPKAVDAIRRAAADVWLYPESTCPYVRTKLAAKLGVEPGNLVFGDGSHELLNLAVQAFVGPGEEILSADLTFSVYKLAAATMGRRYVEVPVKDMGYDLPALANAITAKTKLIFIANPNNPTGTIFRKPEFEAFLAKVPADVVLVMDEAYIEYVADPAFPDSLRYHDGKRRIFTTRTFSKIYGLAGLRIGYGIANPEMIAALEKVRPAFNVNSIAQAAAEAALDDDAHVKKSREIAQAGIEIVTRELDKLGVRSWPSHTNFVMADVKRPAREFMEAMIKKAVIIRPVGPTLARITVGTAEQNARLLAALGAVLRNG